jgi:two-component system chemotaxis sensor kinase CheA
MSIDLSQFHQVFYEESYEGLDAMERGLLEMDVTAPDDEVINTIFRAAHSIKGGAGTFGFNQVAGFTHVIETLLDEVRSGDRGLDQSSMDLLLQSVDCMRSMLEELQAGNEPDMTTPDDLRAQFEAILKGENAGASEGDSAESVSESGGGGSDNNSDETAVDETDGGWSIDFIPEPQMLQTGNEATRMLRQLNEICEGNMQVQAHVDKLPSFLSMNPELCYLSWHIDVNHALARSEIDEIFEWVVDDAQIIITPHSKETTPAIEAEATPISPDIATQTVAPVADIAPVVAPQEKAAVAKKPPQESSSIRVDIEKVDNLINMVGELVITQSMLGELGENFDMSHVQRLQEGLAQLEHNTRELQESVMKIRMMPISFVFSRFPRLVRDTARKLDKKIELKMSGENTELDKTVMEKLGDPMVHLIRNSMDHGIEDPATRVANGKGETGTVDLKAYHQSGNIVIEIEDDGAGLNTKRILEKAKENGIVPQDANLSEDQIFDLIFQPGFSTADVVSDLSGRGVGMDVVRRNIAALNGSIEVFSQAGKGSRFVIRLPLTLAILDGQLVQVEDQVYIFPLVSIVESIQYKGSQLNNVGGHNEVLQLRNEYVPIVLLNQVFGIKTKDKTLDEAIIVVVEADGEKIGIVVDELQGQQQVVIKSLEENYKKVDGISGATILGDGTVALIIDVSGINKMTSGNAPLINNNVKPHKAA